MRARNTAKLTQRQQKTLEWIIKFKEEQDMPPTVREIGRAFGIKSSSAHARLKQLERKGYLRRGNLGARSLVVGNIDQTREVSTERDVEVGRQAKERPALHPPFRYKDLLPMTPFVSYCSRRGVQIFKYQRLEYYERMNLLLPAVIMDREQIDKHEVLRKLWCETIEEYSVEDHNQTFVRAKLKQDETDYHFGGVLSHDGDWYSKYQERRFIERLTKSRSDGSSHNNEGKTIAFEPSSNQVRFYAKHQVFSLRCIQNTLRLTIADEALSADDECWKRAGREVRTGLGFWLYRIREWIRSYYDTFALLNEVRDLIDEMFVVAQKVYDESRKDGGSNREAMKDARSCIELWQKTTISRKAETILRKSGLSQEELIRRRKKIIQEGLSLDPVIHWFPYVDTILPHVVDNFWGSQMLALDCYGIANELGWFLRMLGCECETLAESLVGKKGHNICPYCNGYYRPKSRRQSTCGRQRCVQDNKNTMKRLRRSMGL